MKRVSMDEFRRNAHVALRKLPFELTLDGETVAIVTEPTEAKSKLQVPLRKEVEAVDLPFSKKRQASHSFDT